MYAVSQIVEYCLLFAVIAVNGQDTREGGRQEPQETILSTLLEMRNMVGNLNERFDRMEERIKGIENNVKELKQNVFDELGRITTSQSNHTDQLNKITDIVEGIQTKNEVLQSHVSNVTRLLLVFTKKISNTTQRGCDEYNVIAQKITNLTDFIIDRDVMATKQVHDVIGNASSLPGVIREGTSNQAVPRDCADIRTQGQTTSGVYTVYIGESQRPLAVYCDMTTGSVGWTVFQRRLDGRVIFFLNWTDYQTGFGNISEEFWIGNDNLHLITSSKRYKLRVELTDFQGTTAYAEFDNFTVASAADKYRLTSVGNYSGTASNSLSWNVGHQFSTKDSDNDQWFANCAVHFQGAWWYNECTHCNLNGNFYRTETYRTDGVLWYHWRYNYLSMRRTEMKLTPFI